MQLIALTYQNSPESAEQARRDIKSFIRKLPGKREYMYGINMSEKICRCIDLIISDNLDLRTVTERWRKGLVMMQSADTTTELYIKCISSKTAQSKKWNEARKG